MPFFQREAFMGSPSWGVLVALPWVALDALGAAATGCLLYPQSRFASLPRPAEIRNLTFLYTVYMHGFVLQNEANFNDWVQSVVPQDPKPAGRAGEKPLDGAGTSERPAARYRPRQERPSLSWMQTSGIADRDGLTLRFCLEGAALALKQRACSPPVGQSRWRHVPLSQRDENSHLKKPPRTCLRFPTRPLLKAVGGFGCQE